MYEVGYRSHLEIFLLAATLGRIVVEFVIGAETDIRDMFSEPIMCKRSWKLGRAKTTIIIRHTEKTRVISKRKFEPK